MILKFSVILAFVLATLAVSYAVYHISMRDSDDTSDKRPEEKAKPVKDLKCELNEIMGYDFIQIKTLNKRPSVPQATIEELESELMPSPSALFAAGGKSKVFDEDIPEDDMLNLTDDDLEEIAAMPFSNDLVFDEAMGKLLIEQYASYEEAADEDDGIDPESAAALKEYSDKVFDMLETKLDEDDISAMDEIRALLANE